MRESFLVVVLAYFKHCFDLTIIKIIIPLYNTVNTIVFESIETMDSTFPFLIQRNIHHKILLVGTVVAFKNVYSSDK